MVPEEGVRSGATTCWCRTWRRTRPTPRSGSNYYYEPEVAAKLAAWVNYICPVEGAREEMEKIDPSLVDNPLIFPDDDDAGEDHVLHGARRRGRDTSTKEQFAADVTGG